MELLKPENENNVTFEFHEACIRGNIDKITNLMKRKEEIDVKQLDKKHTLKRTVQNEDSGIVQSLLRIGVNVNQKHSPTGIRPLHYACAAQCPWPSNGDTHGIAPKYTQMNFEVSGSLW